MPARMTGPSRSSMPSARSTAASANGAPVSGTGRAIASPRARKSSPRPRSTLRVASAGQRGRQYLSSRARNGCAREQALEACARKAPTPDEDWQPSLSLKPQSYQHFRRIPVLAALSPHLGQTATTSEFGSRWLRPPATMLFHAAIRGISLSTNRKNRWLRALATMRFHAAIRGISLSTNRKNRWLRAPLYLLWVDELVWDIDWRDRAGLPRAAQGPPCPSTCCGPVSRRDGREVENHHSIGPPQRYSGSGQSVTHPIGSTAKARPPPPG